MSLDDLCEHEIYIRPFTWAIPEINFTQLMGNCYDCDTTKCIPPEYKLINIYHSRSPSHLMYHKDK